MRHARWILPIVMLAAFSSPAWAQRNLTRIPDPDPELERQSFQVADGFEVNLFAADPVLAKPLQLNFDPEGRLWVVSSEVYPQIQPGQTANDKVLVLEDRDGDGRADSTRVFADGLLIPTGVAPGDGGVYVANSTELVHFRDTDGDGKADRRRVVLSGFGTEDTHHILHTLRWAPDGMLYFNQSIYIHSHIETPWGVRRLGGGGIWQFRTESMRLEVFAKGLVNPWGHQIDRWGQSFATDGAGGEGINYVPQGAVFLTSPGATRILQGLNPGSPKYCGLEILSGRHMPESWRGSLVTNDFRGNRVCRFVLSEDGSGYASREQPELIKTSHVAFRPIDVAMGPDGALYIADWYNPIIQHGEVDFRDPRRDHTRGRIWRVTAKGRPLVERPQLAGASVEALLDALKAPEDWTRQQARRVLKERGAREVVPALAAWLGRLDPADPETIHHRLEALWIHQSLDVVEPELLTALLTCGEPRARAAACRIVGLWHDRLSDPLALLDARITDPHPRVRLEAVRALAMVADARSVALALKALDAPMDRFLDFGLWMAVRDLSSRWLDAWQNGRLDLGGDRKTLYALETVGTSAVLGPLVGALKGGQLKDDALARPLGLIAKLGSPDDLRVVFDLASVREIPARRRVALLDALARAVESRSVSPKGDLNPIGSLLESPEEPTRTAAARLVGLWKVEGQRAALMKASLPAPVADEALARLGGSESRKELERRASEAGSARPSDRAAAAVALAALDPRLAADLLLEVLTAKDPAGENWVESTVGDFLRRKGGSEALTAALAARRIDPDSARLALRAVTASGRTEPALIEAVTRAGRLEPWMPNAAARQTFLAEKVLRDGDPAKGEAIFRRASLGCLKCHAVAGAGGLVGPSLESVGASAPVDYLLDSLLEPSKAIKEGYHSVIVATSDGLVLTGIRLNRTDSDLVIRDAEGRETLVPIKEIEAEKPGLSLMPAGLLDPLTEAERGHLVRFLSELGKTGGAYTVGQTRLARRWQTLADDPATRSELGRSGAAVVAGDSEGLTWLPAYARVAGALPLADLARLDGVGKAARTQVDVSTPGRVGFRVSGVPNPRVWVDGRPVESPASFEVELPTGRHTITVLASEDAMGDLRCELADVAGSAAKAQFVVGK